MTNVIGLVTMDSFLHQKNPNLLGSYDIYVFFQAKLNISPVTVNCPPIYLSCSGFMKNGNTLGKTPANVGIEMARMLK